MELYAEEDQPIEDEETDTVTAYLSGEGIIEYEPNENVYEVAGVDPDTEIEYGSITADLDSNLLEP